MVASHLFTCMYLPTFLLTERQRMAANEESLDQLCTITGNNKIKYKLLWHVVNSFLNQLIVVVVHSCGNQRNKLCSSILKFATL